MDLWTSSYQQAVYPAVTCSIVDEYYALHDLLLDISPFPEARHTGENIAAWLRGASENYGLTTADVTLATPDSAANMLRSCDLLDLPLRPCFAHLLRRCLMYALGVSGPEKEQLSENT